MDVRALRTQIDILTEVVTLARPVAQQITRHAEHAAESAAATDALMLLDSRVHHAGQEVTRADEGVSMMRSGPKCSTRQRPSLARYWPKTPPRPKSSPSATMCGCACMASCSARAAAWA